MLTCPIRLLAVDLDGTVLNDQKQLTARTRAALAAAAEKGVAVVPATGRTAVGLPDELLAVPGVRYAITSNGARVLDLASGRALRELYIPRRAALAAYDALRRYDCMIDLFEDGQGYTTAAARAAIPRFVPEGLRPYIMTTRQLVPDMRAFIAGEERGIEKLTLFFAEEGERRRAWAEMEALGLTVVSSLPLNMELNAPGADKGAGLLALAGSLGLPAAALMACGDAGNDVPMLRAAGLGVAMENATPDAKAAADYITASNNADGVALAVERFILDYKQ